MYSTKQKQFILAGLCALAAKGSISSENKLIFRSAASMFNYFFNNNMSFLHTLNDESSERWLSTFKSLRGNRSLPFGLAEVFVVVSENGHIIDLAKAIHKNDSNLLHIYNMPKGDAKIGALMEWLS